MQNVLVTLTTAGSSTGPFDIYSNSDSYAVPLVSGVSKATLLAGYVVSAPDDATILRITSTGTCTNSIDLGIGVYVDSYGANPLYSLFQEG